MSTTLQQALNAVNMADFASSFPEEWLTVSHEVNEDDLSFVPAVIRQYAEYCSLKEECIVSVEKMAGKIQNSPFLTVIFQNIFRAVFLSESSLLKNPWPDFQNIFGEQAPLCWLLIALGIVPHVQKLHQKHNVSEKVSRDTCCQIRCYCDNYEIGKKSYGIYLNQLRWLRCYMDDELLYLRFNRLEFMTRKNYLPCYVFQHKTSQKIITFNGCSMAFDQNGFALAGMDDPETAFVSSFEMQDNRVQGTTVDKQGRTSREISKITGPLRPYSVNCSSPVDAA